MSLYERIEQAARERKISITNLEKEVGLSNGAIGKWKESMPKADKLYVVAKFLGKSVEYFLVGEESNVVINDTNYVTNSINKSPNSVLLIHGAALNKQEMELISTYRELSIKQQADLINYLLTLKSDKSE